MEANCVCSGMWKEIEKLRNASKKRRKRRKRRMSRRLYQFREVEEEGGGQVHSNSLWLRAALASTSESQRWPGRTHQRVVAVCEVLQCVVQQSGGNDNGLRLRHWLQWRDPWGQCAGSRMLDEWSAGGANLRPLLGYADSGQEQFGHCITNNCL